MIDVNIVAELLVKDDNIKMVYQKCSYAMIEAVYGYGPPPTEYLPSS